MLERAGIIDWGDTVDTEFFVIRLRDVCAQVALRAYAAQAALRLYGAQVNPVDSEYSDEVLAMSYRSGPHHPNPKVPD